MKLIHKIYSETYAGTSSTSEPLLKPSKLKLRENLSVFSRGFLIFEVEDKKIILS